MILNDFLKTVVYVCLLPAPLLFGADDPTPEIRRPSLGFRIEYYANPLFSTTTVETSTTKPVASYTYTGSTPGASLPYYVPGTSGAVGTVGYVTLGGSAASTITAPVAGAFSPDDKLFFVSTAGDNLVHYISVPTLTDTQQISPNLPACTPVSAGGNDAGCTLAVPTSNAVPATAVAVKPRATT